MEDKSLAQAARKSVRKFQRQLSSRFSSKKLQDASPLEDEELHQYDGYPFVQDLLKYGPIRDRSFQCHGYVQFEYPRGDTGWISSLLIIRGRALDTVVFPFTLATVHAIVVSAVFEHGPFDADGLEERMGDWTTFYGLVLNMILSFLLVFRLTRAAARYWNAREYWGVLLGRGRSLTSALLIYGGHNPTVRDEAIRWIAACAVSVMAFMRNDERLPEGTLAGILEEGCIQRLESAKHMPLYATDRIRDAFERLFHVSPETPLSIAHTWAMHQDRLEKELTTYMDQFGAMERIRGTPLLIVYVTHLRTLLLLHLLLFPYVFWPSQGWATVPLTMMTAFAFLGIEGASMDVENPFKKGRVNNLNMDALAMALIQNIQQQVQTRADLDISRRQSTEHSEFSPEGSTKREESDWWVNKNGGQPREEEIIGSGEAFVEPS